MEPSSTHAARRRAMRALTVGGAAMAVTFAAAVPAFADDNVTPTTPVVDTAASTTAVTATAAADTGTAVASTVVATTPAADTPAAVSVETSSTTVAPAAPAAPAAPNGDPGTGASTSASNSGGTSSANSHGANSTAASHDNQGNNGNGGNGPGQTGGHNPPGNNGTVKIHDVPGDTQPYDVPHLSCTGYVDFFGFDNGQSVTVTFTGQAPTGKGIPLYTWGPQVISTTDAGGAGNDFDYEFSFTADQLNVASLGEPALQGYHVKMLVETGEPGGKKYKVFWIQPCLPTTSGGGHHHHHHGGGGETGGGHHHHGGGGETSGGTVSPPKVKAVHEHRPVTRTPQATQVLGLSVHAPSAQSLPFTGAHDLGAQLLAAITALTGGAALSFAGRRRRTAAVR